MSNPRIRALLLFAAAAALASLAAAFATPASGQRGSRRGMENPAEAERIERERRDREMREGDLRERQFLLRSMRPDPAPAERPNLRLAVAQIREDFVRLQVVNNDLARAVSKGGALDLKLVSKSAAEIKKLAGRLRDNLALPEPEGDGERPKGAAGPAQLGPALTALDGLILKFADDLASRGVYQSDAQRSAAARRRLEEIIALSGWVKKASEKLEKSPRPQQ